LLICRSLLTLFAFFTLLIFLSLLSLFPLFICSYLLNSLVLLIGLTVLTLLK
jgi:hypothetical protein